MMMRVLILLVSCSVLVSGPVTSAGAVGQNWDICTFKDPIGSQPLDPNYLSLDSSRDELVIADIVRRVNHAGYTNTELRTIKLSLDNTWYIALIGPYNSKSRLDEDRRALRQLGFHAVPRAY